MMTWLKNLWYLLKDAIYQYMRSCINEYYIFVAIGIIERRLYNEIESKYFNRYLTDPEKECIESYMVDICRQELKGLHVTVDPNYLYIDNRWVGYYINICSNSSCSRINLILREEA